MRKLKLVFGICVVVIFLAGCKTTEVNIVKKSTMVETGISYTYVDIDPFVIGQTWDALITVSINQFMAEIYYLNPDKDATIQFATLVVSPAGIGGYSYMVNGQIYVCAFNEEKKGYESVWNTLDAESKQQWRDDYKTNFGLSKS